MVKNKTNKDKIVEAHPGMGFLSGINIKGGKDIDIRIGGFTSDGGIVLESPYELVKEESKTFGGKDVTYYNFVKSSKKMSEREKKIREDYNKRKLEEKKWRETRIKEIKEELARYEKEDKK